MRASLDVIFTARYSKCSKPKKKSGHDSIGISAVRVAVGKACDLALQTELCAGVAAVGVVNCGHTGRIGEFAEEGMEYVAAYA